MGHRVGVLAAAVALLLVPATVGAHVLDHTAPGFAPQSPPPATFLAGGEDAEWELVATLATGNPHTDLDFFTRGGETYASVGTLAVGPNAGGQTIVQLTQGGAVKPRVVASHPSASCVSRPDVALSLQHDVEAAPKGRVPLNTFNPAAATRDAEILIDATDAEGRCHDQGALGVVNAPSGGLEIIDVTNPAEPVEIGLTTHIGEAHTVNVDPKRPHIAYAVTSDAVTVNADGQRENEIATDDDRFDLDGFEIVDLSSCMGFAPGTSTQAKRDRCRPQVYRYRYPTLAMAQGHTNKGTVYGCHELEVYPDDRLTCGSGQALIHLDLRGAFDDRGTPGNYADDRPRGTPLPCRVRPSSNTGPSADLATGALITDCVDGAGTGTDDLTVARWLAAGAPSLAGVRHLGTAFHQGRTSTSQSATPAYPSTEDIDFDHEAELSASRRLLLATDERGGGVAPPGATCPTSPGDNPIGNGGLHAYRVGKLAATTPATAEEAHAAYARTSKGGKAIYRAPVRTQPQGSLCTAHVFQQIPGQNRIFMGWYSQGTQVVDFTENADGTVDFEEAGWFIPTNANTWTSAVFKTQRNPDGSFTYWGATGDFNLGAAGRNAIDVYKVTLPPPPTPRGGTGSAGAPRGGGRDADSCRVRTGFRAAAVKRRGRGLRFAFRRAGRRPVQVDVHRQSAGRAVVGPRRIRTFRGRRRSFSWTPRRLARGHYTVKMRGRRGDVRAFAVRRARGRFSVSRAYQRPPRCGTVRRFSLGRPVFGGRSRRGLAVRFRLERRAAVKLTLTRGGRVVRTTVRRSYRAGRTFTVRFPARGTRRGLHAVTLSAERGASRASLRLFARRL